MAFEIPTELLINNSVGVAALVLFCVYSLKSSDKTERINDKMAAAIDRNNAAIDRNTEAMHAIKERLK